jgi:hypothetical protein
VNGIWILECDGGYSRVVGRLLGDILKVIWLDDSKRVALLLSQGVAGDRGCVDNANRDGKTTKVLRCN